MMPPMGGMGGMPPGMPGMGMGMGGMPPGLPPGMMPQMAPLPYPPAATTPETAMSQIPGLDPMTMLMLLQQSADPMASAGLSQQGGYQQGMSPLLAALMEMGAVPPQAQV